MNSYEEYVKLEEEEKAKTPDKRAWIHDGRCLSAADARQVVSFNKRFFCKQRYRWLLVFSCNAGHDKDIHEVFVRALADCDDGQLPIPYGKGFYV